MLNRLGLSNLSNSMSTDRERLLEQGEDESDTRCSPSRELRSSLYCLGAGACVLAAGIFGLGCYIWAVSNTPETIETNSEELPASTVEALYRTFEPAIEAVTTSAGEIISAATEMAADSCITIVNETECIIKNVCDKLVFYRSSQNDTSAVLIPHSTYNCTGASNNTSFSFTP